MRTFTGVILAGGKSSRMGKNKALLRLNDQEIIKIIADKLSKLTSNLLIVSNDIDTYEFLGIKIVKDIYPGRGALAGIHSGLYHAPTEYSFFIACDTPFLNQDLVNFLYDQRVGFDAVVPQLGEFLQPLYAFYSRNCLEAIERVLNNDQRRIRRFYEHIRVNYIGESLLKDFGDLDKIFYNINTPREYEDSLKIIQDFNI